MTEQPPEPLKFPELDTNTIRIVNACKQVLWSYDDHESDTMTTPITLVHACERLNCVIKDIRTTKTPEQLGVPVLAADVNGKLLNEKELRALDKHIKQNSKPEQPNTELMIIKTIQGLISQATKEIGKLSDKRNTRVIRCKAIEEIDSFEKTTLFELQKAFE